MKTHVVFTDDSALTGAESRAAGAASCPRCNPTLFTSFEEFDIFQDLGPSLHDLTEFHPSALRLLFHRSQIKGIAFFMFISLCSGW
jgi:hypothetical protein